MEAAKKVHAYIPRGSGLGAKIRDHVGTLRDLGFDVTFRRTRAERTIEITPIPPA